MRRVSAGLFTGGIYRRSRQLLRHYSAATADSHACCIPASRTGSLADVADAFRG